MISGDLRKLGAQLRTIESIAVIPRVGSTLDLGNRVVAECIENELPVPSALIIANEQSAGRGRGDRSWHSPSGGGIYATLTFAVPSAVAGLLPLSIAVATAGFIRDRWGVDAKLKWPNDVLVEGKKIAGILISARHHAGQAYVAAGIGINLRHFDHGPEQAVSVEDITGEAVDVDQASEDFIRWFDEHFDRDSAAPKILEEWRSQTVHRPGDAIRCRVGEEVIAGNWAGIDEAGHAMLDRDDEQVRIPAGDLIDWK